MKHMINLSWPYGNKSTPFHLMSPLQNILSVWDLIEQAVDILEGHVQRRF